MTGDYFLEAHYYSGGLRHRPYTLADGRPEWAPAPDTVGFNDEFRLERGTAAVELRRIEHDGQRLTWLAVYYPSVDSKLGARSNHAGVGVWLNELTIIEGRNLIHGLDLLSSKLAQSVDPDALESHARDFLSKKFMGAYVAPLDDYPGFAGLKFGRGKLPETKLAYLKTADSPGDCPALGDHVAGMLFLNAANSGGSRELICVSSLEQPTRDHTIFEKIAGDEDQLSTFLKELPKATKQLVEDRKQAEQQAVALKTENETLRRELSDYGDMKERFRGFEENPLGVVLDEIRNLERKIDSMPSRTEYVRPPASSGMHFPPVRRNPVTTTTQRRSEESPADEYGWLFLGVLGLIFFLVIVIIFLGIQRFGPWTL
jgi:regulator of replication initiation timing